jgi:TolB protein
MKRMSLLLFSLAISAASLFSDSRHIAFERDQAVWTANLDGTGEKKIADGVFPAISPDGTRVVFNTTEKTSDTTYARHIAVVDLATGKINVLKDVPSDNSYYPSWTADGKQILFTTRPHEVWDLSW